MEHSGLIRTERKGAVLYVTLNRPDKLNALIEPMREELYRILDSLHQREDTRVCVITGTRPAFCAGGDIQVMEQIIEAGDYDRIQEFLQWGRLVVTTIRSLPIPVLARVNGAAAGAGMNLALACDLRLASAKATFGQTFIHIGLHPDWGGTFTLPHAVNTGIALDLLWTGRILTAQEALDIGLVNRLFADEAFADQVDAFAQALAAKPKRVLALAKAGVYAAASADLDASLTHEERAQEHCIRSGEAREGMRAFLEERDRRRKAQCLVAIS